MITISEILELPIFNEATLIAGNKGLHQPVRWVTILELLDDINKLEKGELLLTTAFDLSSSDKLKKNIVYLLHNQGVSGIIIQTGYYLETIPQEMVDQSNILNFPIIDIPKTISFSEITKVVHKHILNKQFEKIQFSEEMYRKFTEIALNNKGLNPIAKAISTLVKGQTIIFDVHMNMLSSISNKRNKQQPDTFGHDLLLKYRASDIEILPEPFSIIEHESHFILIANVQSKNEIFGYFVIIKEEPFNAFEEIAIKHASTISALEFINLLNLKKKENTMKADFLDLILTGDFSDELIVYSKGEALGYKIDSQDSCVAIIKIDNYEALSPTDLAKAEGILQQTLLKKLQESTFKTLMKRVSGQFVVLITKEVPCNTNISEILSKIKDYLYSVCKVTLSIGIGNYYNDFKFYQESFKEAQEALFIIQSVWKNNQCLHYKDLGFYKLLLPVLQNRTLIEEYNRKILGNILEDEVLLETLQVYLEDMKMNETANKLFIHRHTLKYRIKKIESVTDKVLSNFKDRIELELAIILHNILK